ncbi:DUF1801 domain-containing protein [Enhygromyxa salina]|uniref:YdhG-like domain-containing protein n=1 Tax=Enhygromyxa salina TaxID=215803 RepID=A0A2S9XU82_9BACT|nr:DUF1801 domain-containing protein [Enhygromyxa salina]PRP96415.1 hypothetical protein ENSA7_72300 [Enhygromyxa salina]
MAELQTKPTDAKVTDFLAAIADEQQRADAQVIVELMREVTKAEAQMWGPSIVGFGSCHYVYESGREGDWFLTGFSPRARNLTLYIMPGFEDYAELLGRLGKHKTGKSCLYINRLADVDLKVLRTLVKKSAAHIKRKYKPSSPGAAKGVAKQPVVKKPAAKKAAVKKAAAKKKPAARKKSASRV